MGRQPNPDRAGWAWVCNPSLENYRQKQSVNRKLYNKSRQIQTLIQQTNYQYDIKIVAESNPRWQLQVGQGYG